MSAIGSLDLNTVVQLLALGAAWGHLALTVKSNRERSDERHQDNLNRLDNIDEHLRALNGQVATNTTKIAVIEAGLHDT